EARVSFSHDQVVEVEALLKARVDRDLCRRGKNMSHVSAVDVGLLGFEDDCFRIREQLSEEVSGSTAWGRAQLGRIDLGKAHALQSEGMKAQVDEHFKRIAVDDADFLCLVEVGGL